MIISPKKCPLFLQGGRGSSQFWQCQDFGTIWTPIPYLTIDKPIMGCNNTSGLSSST